MRLDYNNFQRVHLVQLRRLLIKLQLRLQRIGKGRVCLAIAIFIFSYYLFHIIFNDDFFSDKTPLILNFEAELPLDSFLMKFANRRKTYKMLRADPRECEGKEVVIMVMSTGKDNSAKLRDAMRRTMFREQPTVLHKFFIGYDKDFPVSSLVDEMNQYKDIVYYDGRGDYRSNYLKWYAMYQWHAKYCPKVKTFVKLDDDTTVYVPRLLQWIKRDFNHLTGKKEDYVICQVYNGMQPVRVKSNHWYISPKDYPHPYWPSYCVGYFVLMSNSTVIRLLAAAEKVNWFPMDDVLLTGATSEVAQIPVIDFEGVRSEPREKMCTKDGLHFAFMRHNSKFAHIIEEDYNYLKGLKCPTKPFEEAE